MVIDKQKDYSNISLTDIKQHLRIYTGDTSNDSELEALIAVGVSAIESFIQFDVVPTYNQLTDYDYCGQYYCVFEPNIQLSGITGTTVNSDNTINTIFTIPVSGCSIEKHSQYSLIRFPYSFSADIININFSTGSSTLKSNVLHALKLKMGEFFDADRNGATTSNITKTKSFERLLSAEMNLLS